MKELLNKLYGDEKVKSIDQMYAFFEYNNIDDWSAFKAFSHWINNDMIRVALPSNDRFIKL